MEISDLEQLVELVRGANVGELTVRHGSERITIRKAAQPSPSLALVQTDEDYVYTTEYSEPQGEEWNTETEQENTTFTVTAPLVGVFGHVKPIAGLNSRVTEGQVLGVIEAMKIITEIEAPTSGIIVDVFIEAGHPVEYGQALFEISPGSRS